MGIKWKSAVSSAGTASKRLKDGKDDKHDADIIIHSQKSVPQEHVKMLRKSKHLYQIPFGKIS